MNMRKLLWCPVIAIVMLLSGPAAHAQLNSATTSVSLSATLAESLSVTASPSTVSFTLLPSGTATGNASVSIVTTWVLKTTRTTVKTYAYFANATSALTDGGTPANLIASSDVYGSINSGTNTAFTGASPFAAASSLTVFSLTIASGNANRNSSHTDTLGLTIDTTGDNLPAATYTGTLIIQAQAI